MLLRAAPGSTVGGRRQRLVDARDSVIRSYRDHHIALTPGERDQFQAVKEKVIEVILYLELVGVWNEQHLRLGHAHSRNIEQVLPLMNQAQQRLLSSAVGNLESLLLGRPKGESHD